MLLVGRQVGDMLRGLRALVDEGDEGELVAGVVLDRDQAAGVGAHGHAHLLHAGAVDELLARLEDLKVIRREEGVDGDVLRGEQVIPCAVLAAEVCVHQAG